MQISLPWRPQARSQPLKSASAFSALYDRTHLNVYRYIYGLTGGPRQDAEDLTAETYLKAWRPRKRFQGSDEDALRWLFTIAKRLVIDRSRRTKARPLNINIENEIVVAPDTSPEERAAFVEQSQILLGLLHELEPNHREMLVLRYMLGWQVNQIAEHFEQKPNTVTVTIKRLLTRLRNQWPHEYNTEENYD